MMNFPTVFHGSHKHPLQSAVMGTLSVLTLIAGVSISEVAHADPPGDMTKYTEIAQKVEQNRQTLYNQVKGIMGGNVPENVCQQNNLPRRVRDICDRFESTSRDIIVNNGMTVAQFNEHVRYCRKTPKPQACPP